MIKHRLSRLIAACLGALWASAVMAVDWSQPWLEPQDPAAAADAGDEYAWRLFVALNWPVDPATGAADPSRKPGAAGPVVWESWRNAKTIFRKDGADPGAWSPQPDLDALPAAERFEGLPLDPRVVTRHIVDGVMVPVADPIALASHLNETHMNRRSYEFIRAWRLYNLDGQLQLYAERRPVSFPLGAKQVKAQWRPIAASQKSRYFSAELSMADGSRRLYGLTAMHIVSKDLPDWFWASFEHVDNPSLPGAVPWTLPSRDRFACAGKPADCGAAPRGIGLEGSVWQYYRLRGSMNNYVDSAGKPALLANSQLESRVEPGTSSCITCHSRASIGRKNLQVVRLSVFDSGSDATAASDTLVADHGRGFTGPPRPQWFGAAGDGGQNGSYLPLDFVWSLQKAQPRAAQRAEPTGSMP